MEKAPKLGIPRFAHQGCKLLPRPQRPPATSARFLGSACVTSSNVLRTGCLQTKLNAGLSEQQQEDLFQNERSFHEVNSRQHVLDELIRPPPT